MSPYGTLYWIIQMLNFKCLDSPERQGLHSFLLPLWANNAKEKTHGRTLI
jgi:hypothetical protein